MKRFLINFILLIIVVVVGYYFRDRLFPNLDNLLYNAKSYFFPKVPCKEPIPYNLGTFDARFNISKNYFLSAISEAEAIWEKPSGFGLFVYAPEDSSRDVLKINLIYDYRQQATSKLSSLGIVVGDNRASYDMLKAKFTALKTEYENKKSDYDARVQAFNRGDRTDATEFKSLQKEQQNLNNMVDEINALVVVLNRLVATLNLSVEKYNAVNVSRGESFEEGVYRSEGLSREIDIYEFSNRDKLVRVLAHELGHALELNHVDDTKAIMYEFNRGTSTATTAADLAALKEHCGVQ